MSTASKKSFQIELLACGSKRGAGEAEERPVDVGAALVADGQALEVVQRGEPASIPQRKRPSPEPCSLWRRAISGRMPRSRGRRRYLSWS